jgi:RHS repeat-associated protein
MQDENGGNTDYDYDVYGRLEQEDYPGPGVKTIDYDDTARPRFSVTRMNSGNDVYRYIDGLDRTLQITERGTSSNNRTTRYYYDGAGRRYNTAGPFFTSGYGYFTSSIPSGAPYSNIGDNFDFLNRPERIASPRDVSNEAITTISYNGFNRTVTDPDNRATVEYRDYLGRIFAIQEANGRTTNYDYNGAADLTSVTDTLGNTTSMPHNWLGQMTVLDDPDLGRWTFTYMPNGEVRTRTDQKGQVITYDYDNRNRLRSKTYTSEGAVALTYDSATNGNGRLYSVTKGSATTTYTAYDDMGRVTQKTVTIDGQNYLFGYAYDAVGNLTRITYPDGYALNYGYHSGTNLLSTATGSSPALSVNMSGYSNFAKAGTISYPATTTSIGYFSRTGRVDGISVPGLMAMDYTYTAAGDVSAIYDNERNLSYVYTYDNLHRLRTETAIGPFYRPAGRSINLYYESPDEVHAPSRVVADGQTRNLIYEDNGNLVIGYDFSQSGQPPERRLTYNAENMPLTIEHQPQGGSTTTTQLTYDGDGRRVRKQTGSDSVIYVDETYEIRNGQPVKYVFAGDRRVARIRGSEVHYFHKDHLGSSTLVTNAAGVLLESTTYEAYGLQRPDCDPKLNNVAYTFTDQEWDSETGLYNYDARLYDPVLGRFLSADSVVSNWYDPQALNRYSYALNNPLKYVDPNGHHPVLVAGVVIGAAMWLYDSIVSPHNAIAPTPSTDVAGITNPSNFEHASNYATVGTIAYAALASGGKAAAKEVADEVLSNLTGGATDLAKVAKSSETTLDLLKSAERNKSGALKVDGSTLQQIGKAEAKGGKGFSGLVEQVEQSKNATWQGKVTGGQQTVIKYVDPSTGKNKFTVHTVTDGSGKVVHRDFDSVMIQSGQQVVK